MSAEHTDPPLQGIARRLVTSGLFDEATVRHAQQQATLARQPLLRLLQQQQQINSATAAHLASHEFGLPLLDLAAFEFDPQVTSLISEKLVRQHQVLPLFQRGNRLAVAIADPTNTTALDDLKFHTSRQIDPIVVDEERLIAAIDHVFEPSHQLLDDIGDADLEALEVAVEAPAAESERGDSELDDAPVVRFVNKILLDAIHKGASDIHFEPFEKQFRIRFRLDGILHEMSHPPVQLATKIAARLKVMSQLDIAERRVPQDGRIKLNISRNKSIDFRVSSCPTLFGEKVVLRILDSASARLGIDALGYEPQQKQLYLDALARPHGMILVTGPTGSGKTVSLYTGLNILNTSERNISTAEDPAEINLPGVNQVNVNPKVGLTFAAALKSFLRQDPDVIMVGEIRDLETAEIAIKAAQTGHLVLSTLHTNDAPQSLARLTSIGVAPYNIASAVSLIIAQRLARRLCPHCRKEERLPPAALQQQGFAEAELAELTLYRAVGCERCTLGYRGRVGLYQVMPISSAMAALIMAGSNPLELAAQARREGIPDLREAGLEKVRQGITTLEEINRVTRD